MKKSFLVILGLAAVLGLAACGNKQILDTTFTFDKAVISLPDGSTVSGEVQSWKDYEDGDQIQIKINDKTYLVHSSNVVLIAE